MADATDARHLCLAAGALAAVAWPWSAFAQDGVLRILDAEYGDVATHRICNATQLVMTLCELRRTCTIPISNVLCGDPAQGTPKKLHVAFKCEGSVPQLLIAPEPDTVRITCAPAAGPRA